MGKLLSELKGAKYTEIHNDVPEGTVWAWFGGHGVHEYDADGKEIEFINVGDWSKNDATLAEVKKGIRRWRKEHYAEAFA